MRIGLCRVIAADGRDWPSVRVEHVNGRTTVTTETDLTLAVWEPSTLDQTGTREWMINTPTGLAAYCYVHKSCNC